MPPTLIQNLLRNLKTETYALYLAFRDPRTPWYARIFIIVIIAYMLSPVDIIPDFIPIVGYLDDLAVLGLAMSVLFLMVPREVRDECREKAKEDVTELKKTWIIGIIVILLWLVVLFFIGKTLWKIFFSK